MIKNVCQPLTSRLINLYNNILDSHIPQQFKNSIIIPMPNSVRLPALSTRSHLSIISLDFEKAYDKIGIHAIIDELQRWKIGPKLLNFVKNFLTNRKIKVKVSNSFSEDRPLYNGIPQGSPLSVILFLISFNKLCRTIEVHRGFRFFSYADDFTILKKIHKNVNTMSINSLFTDILSWCD